jgi:hypothetical protein
MMSDTQQKTHTLAEVAAVFRLAERVRDPIRWLTRRLNSHELRGIRIGRTWLMTDDHIEFMVRKYSTDGEVPEPTPAEPVTEPEVVEIIDGLSPRSRRRLRGGADKGDGARA